MAIIKQMLLAVLLFCSLISLGQEWSNEELLIKKKYNLDEMDSRGLQFVDKARTKLVFNTLTEALEYFMNPTDIRTDITKVYINKMPKDLNLRDEIIGIHKAVKLYIKYNNNKKRKL